jgi:hypothetical protein
MLSIETLNGVVVLGDVLLSLRLWLEIEQVELKSAYKIEPRMRKEQFDEETRGSQSKAKTGSKHPHSKFSEEEVHKIKLGLCS